VKHLALFPHQNPNPVFEISYVNKKITYINPAGLNKIPNPEAFTFDVMADLFKISPESILERDTTKKEFEWQGKYYERNIFFLDDHGVFRLYLHDITDIRLKEKLDYESNQEFLRQQNVLLEMRSLSQDLPLEEKIKIIYRKTTEILNCSRCSIWLYNEDKTTISSAFIYLKDKGEFIEGTSIHSKDVPGYFGALEQRNVINAFDAETDPATKEFKDAYLRPLNIKSMLDIPLIQAENSIGVICNEYVGEKKVFTDDEISFAATNTWVRRKYLPTTKFHLHARWPTLSFWYTKQNSSSSHKSAWKRKTSHSKKRWKNLWACSLT
jgi:hypothetical protein